MNEFNLDQLKNGSEKVTNDEGLLDTTTTKISTGAASSDGYVEMDIADIKPYKQEENPAQDMLGSMFGDLDNAIAKDMEEITKLKDEAIIKYNEELQEKEMEKDNNKKANDDLDDDDDIKEIEEVKIKPVVQPKYQKNIFDNDDDDDSLAELDEDDLDDDDDEQDKNKEQFDILKESIKKKIVPIQDKIDISKFTVNVKPISLSRALAMETSSVHVADWVLYSSKTAISVSELSGPEILKLDPSNSSRNRLNIYKDIYGVLYNHIIDANKPPTLEAWVKTLNFFDNDHLYFAFYKACFSGTNSVPYSCPECNEMFMEDLPMEKMIKYLKPEVEEEVHRILSKDTTSSDGYPVELFQISDNYVVGLKDPSIYSVIFENAVLTEKFTTKYQDLLSMMSYIDQIYFIDRATGSLNPIEVKNDPLNVAKTTMHRIKNYHSILSSLNSDQYYQFASYIKTINDRNENIEYILPEVTCPKCKHIIKEEKKTPQSLLFTRHQLAALLNI